MMLFLHISGRITIPCSEWHTKCSEIVRKIPDCQEGSFNIFNGFSSEQWKTFDPWCGSRWNVVFRSTCLWGFGGMQFILLLQVYMNPILCIMMFKMSSCLQNCFNGSVCFKSMNFIQIKNYLFFLYVQAWYFLSKTLAEEAAWKFAKGNGIDLVTLNPAYVIGPLLQPTLNATVEMVLNLKKGTLRQNYLFHLLQASF